MAGPIALVGRADTVRAQVTKYLRDGGFDVSEHEELAIASRFLGVVVIDDGASPALVEAWLALARPERVVVVTSKPASWRTLELTHANRLWVLAAPAFGWQIVDALCASNPDGPRSA